MKKSPGPLAPPDFSLPSLKMTALSYSWTTYKCHKYFDKFSIFHQMFIYLDTSPNRDWKGEKHKDVGEKGDYHRTASISLGN